MLPALTSEGIVGLEIFKGGVTKEHFLHFLQAQVVCARALFYLNCCVHPLL